MGSPCVCVFAGPSGGHLFPAQAFAESFKRRFPAGRIYLVTSRKGRPLVSRMPDRIFEGVFYLPEFPSPSGISLRAFSFLLKLPRTMALMRPYLSKIRPHLCVGFGSYVSYPGMRLASLKKIATVIHEQNVIPGRATRWLAPHVDLVAASVKNERFFFRARRVCEVGLPLRADLVKGARGRAESRVFQSGRLSILIVGGSQGAHFLNQVTLQALEDLNSEEKRKIAVTHITGAQDAAGVAEAYARLAIRSEIYPFFEKMHELYAAADIAVTRAGANTLFELALFGLPAIVIPYPHARAHQWANAQYFETRGAVWVKQETDLDLTSRWLAQALRDLMKDADGRRKLSRRVSELAQPEAAERLVDLAEGLMTRKGEKWALSKTI